MPPFESAGEPPAAETEKERKKREKRERKEAKKRAKEEAAMAPAGADQLGARGHGLCDLSGPFGPRVRKPAKR